MHSCPTCGQACYRNGDIDDIAADEAAADACTHCDDDDTDDLNEHGEESLHHDLTGGAD